MAIIFVLDGSASAREQIAECLRQRNHRVETFCSAAGLEQALRVQMPDLLILEARLPDGNRFQWVRSLKNNACIPVIFVTYCSSVPERIQGFEAGADDYVVKPFLTQELALRTEGILRRYNR
jgi:DNA-binding response OmpR family regulator